MALEINELSSANFKTTESKTIRYSKQHAQSLPLDTVTEFRWKNYCPAVFRLIQEREDVDYDDYMLSVCCDETLWKLSSPAKPGHLFLLSKDDRFVIKSLRKCEVKVILELLPNYYMHHKKYKTTVLGKLFGIHVVKPVGGPKVYFSVASNVFPTHLFLHKCYDLKGSSQGRTVNKLKVREKTILKDLDLDFCFYLDPLIRHQLLMQIKYDCELLEAAGVMNYSLLLGIQIKASYEVERRCSNTKRTASGDSSHRGSVDSRTLNIKKMFSNDSSLRGSVNSRSSYTSLKVSSNSSHQGSMCSRSSSVMTTISRASSQRNGEMESTFGDILLMPDRPGFRHGMQIQARAVRIPSNEIGHVSPHQSHDVLLQFGIVDYFNSYSMIKRIENAYKSLQYDKKSISAVNPKVYSSRFQDFVSRIFQAEDTNE